MALLALPTDAAAQFANQTGNVVGTIGGVCNSSANDYAWPNTNGAILKCVSNVWTLVTTPATAAGSTGDVQFNSSNALAGDSNLIWDNTNKRLGIGTTAPDNIFSLGGQNVQTVDMVRETTAATVGNNLAVQAGGAAVGGTNLTGGDLVLSGGISTGTGFSNIQFQTYPAAASSGASDNTPTTMLKLFGTGSAASGQGTLTTTLKAATGGGTDKNGGNLVLSSGISTGTGASQLQFNVYGAGSTGTTANAATTAMTIASNGNVGIGTTSPSTALQVNGTAAANIVTVTTPGNIGFELLGGSNGGTVIPVPTFYPVGTNQTLAFDLSPHGTPTDLGYGATWDDMCTTDQITSGSSPTVCLHLSAGTNPSRLAIASAEYSAGTLLPLYFGTFNGDTPAYTDTFVINTDSTFQELNGVAKQTRTVTASGAVTVAKTDHIVFIDKTSGAATTVNLPPSPRTGMSIVIKDLKGDAATNNITITPASGNIDNASTFVINSNYGSWEGVYNGTTWSTVQEGGAFNGTITTIGSALIQGSVGIGTSSPAFPLHLVATDTSATGTITYNSATPFGPYLSHPNALTQIAVSPSADIANDVLPVSGITSWVDQPSSNTHTPYDTEALEGIVTNESTASNNASHAEIFGASDEAYNTGNVYQMEGVGGYAEIDSGTVTNSLQGITGVGGGAEIAGGTAAAANGAFVYAEIDTGGSVTDGVSALNAQTYVSDGTVTGGLDGIYVQPDIFEGSVDTRAGIFIAAGAGAPTGGDYGLYQESTTVVNYFGGKIGIGTIAPQATLDVSGYARLTLNASQPVACSSTNRGAIALNHLAQMCACNGSSWIFADSVGAACSW